MSTIVPIILAGGQGTRLWPASLPHIPKQFLTIAGESLMKGAISRALAVASDEVFVITNETYLPLFSEKLSLTKEEESKIHLVGESAARNTAPAIALALQLIEQKHKDAICLVITADHLIRPEEVFAQDVQKAASIAQKNKIVTFGIVPSRPDTGYGYIECGSSIENIGKDVVAFREKPDETTAQKYLDSGNFLWNSGMFCFPIQKMKDDLHEHCPSLAKDIFSADIHWNNSRQGNYHSHLAENIEYEKIEKISIDYAVMEKASDVAVIPASFTWNDVGSWEEAAALQDINKESQKHVFSSNSNNVNVFSDIPVGICGLDDIIVVVENNRVLVMKKGAGQLVKNIAEADL